MTNRGGARKGAGRKPAWDTPLCGFVVDNTRRLAATMMEAKQKRLLVAWRPEYADVDELQRTLRARTPVGSPPHPETLEDIQFHFAKQADGGLELPRYIPGVDLSPIEWGKVYSDVAAAASSHFGRTISRRQVKRNIAEWLKFERSL